MSDQRPLDPIVLLDALLAHGVQFVVIGGFSLAAHGFVRGTKDVDVVPAPDGANLDRLGAALTSLQASVDLADLDPDELGIAPDGEGLRFGGNWVLTTKHGRLDVMQEVPGVDGFAELRASALAVDVPGVSGPLLFAGLEALLKMKRAAGRPQDLVDIAELERIRAAG